MKVTVQNNVLILVVENAQYIQLVTGSNFQAAVFKKWITDELVTVNERFEVNYCHRIEIDVDGNNCLIDEFNGEYYLITNYVF